MGSNRAKRKDDKRRGASRERPALYEGEVTRKRARGEWIDRKDAARMMGVSTARVSQLIGQGKLAVRRLGRYVTVDSRDCEDLAEAATVRRPGRRRLTGQLGAITADRLEAVLRRFREEDCAKVPPALEVVLLEPDDDLRSGLARLLLDIGVCPEHHLTALEMEEFADLDSAQYQRWLDDAPFEAIHLACRAHLLRNPLPGPGLTARDWNS